jgi:hypothetical protein
VSAGDAPRAAEQEVEVQVAFEKQRLETEFSLYRRKGGKPGGFKLWGN